MLQHANVEIWGSSDLYRLQTYLNWDRHLPGRDLVDPPVFLRTLRCTLPAESSVARVAEFVPILAKELLWLEVFYLRVEAVNFQHTVVSG